MNGRISWNEFKQLVEAKLREKNLDDVEIDYIDFSMVYSDGLSIHIDDDGQLSVH